MSDQGDWDDDPGWTDDGYDDEESIVEGPADAGAGGGGRGYSWLVAVAIVLVIALGVGTAVLASGGDDDDEPSASGNGTSTTLPLGLPGSPGSSTSLNPVTSTTVGVGGSSTTSTTAKSGGSTSTTSTTVPDGPKEPACAPLAGGGAAVPVADGWETRWSTKPNPNDPATLSFCVDDRTPKVGQLVTLTAHAADPDALIPDDQCSVFVSWDGDTGNLCFDTLTAGVKPTPAEQVGDVVVKRTFTYGADQVGQRRIFASTTSGNGRDQSPYSSSAETSLEITVHA